MQWIKTQILHSISVKASIAIFLSCLCIGFIGVYFFSHAQDKYVGFLLSSDIEHSANQNAVMVSRHLASLVALGELANHQVSFAIRQADQSKNVEQTLIKQRDGSYRINAEDTGIYLGANQLLTQAIEAEANSTLAIWPDIAPLIRQSFSNFFFISNNGLFITQPAQLAEKFPAVYDFNLDVYYKVGTPAYNPTRQPIWTPLYFDENQNKWMTSLIIPVYVNGEFKGVTGSDLILNQISELLVSWLPNRMGRELFIFDDEGRLIFHPQYTKNINNYLPTGSTKTLDANPYTPVDIQFIIDDYLESKHINKTKSYLVDDKERLVSVSAIPELGWYLAMSDSLSEREYHLNKFRNILVSGAFIVALVLSIIIYWFLNRYVLARLRIIARAVKHHQQGRLKLGRLTENLDEMGTVARSMEGMSLEIHNLIEGLNEKIQEKEIAEMSALKLSNAVRHSETAIAILNSQFEIEFVNPKFTELSGRDEFELVGVKIESIVDSQMTWVLDTAYEQLKVGHAWKGELLLSRPNNESIWVSQTFSPMTQDLQGANHYVSATQDISFIKQSQKKMEKLAYHDPLTNLYNRTFFKAQLTKSLEMTKRGHFAFSLFYFDLDQFKRINDNLGHEAGDELLVKVSKRLLRRLRAEDTIARLGGDEFAIILSGVASIERASAMAIDIQRMINEPIQLSGAEVLVTASIGITMSPKDASNIETLLRNADLAMYRAKAAGRNTHHFFTDELDKALQESILIESELRVALKENQFELFYQPQIDLSTGTIFGFEALVRWRHPDRGLVSPIVFIPVAEQSGLIVELGEWVLNEASLFIARVNNKYNKNYMVAVNLSARQFKDKNVAKVIRQSIINARIEPKWLDIELTESMLMGDINEALKQMDEIKSLGVQLSIDDFGTGYSSLSYLKKFPVDTLKVDRAFIKDIPNDKDDMAISDAIIAMAHKLKMKVIAEGIESAEHVAFLRQNNCQVGQGFLFSQPLPEDKLYDFIENNNHAYSLLFR